MNLGALVLSRSIERTKEMAVRTALGATRARLWKLSRLMASVLYGVGPHDTTTFLALPAGVVAAAFLASALPARRAASIDPMRTMKSD